MARKRARGKKNPRGETKVSIILYLAEGEKGRQDVFDHLRETYNIRDAKTIDGHLKDLLTEGLVEKEEIGAGFPISYRLAGGYNGLKKIFRFMAENNRELDLLRFPYAQTTINEDVFPEITKDVLKAISYRFYKIVTMSEAELIVDPDFRKILGFMNVGKEVDYSAIRASLKEQFSKPGVIKLRDIVNEKLKPFIEKPEYNAKRDEVINELVGKLIDSIYIEQPFSGVSQHIPLIFFPLNEQKEIIQILRMSPSALSLVVTAQDELFERLMPLLFAYAGYYIFFVMKLLKSIDIEDEELKAERFAILCKDFLQGQISRGTTSTPLLIILRSLSVSDIFSSRVVGSDWIIEYCMKLLGFDKDSFVRLLNEQTKKIEEKPREAPP